MGFNTAVGGKGSRPTTFAKLIGGENAGFRVGENVYNDVSGHIAGFYVRQELNFEAAKRLREAGQDPSKVDLSSVDEADKHFTGTIRLRDTDPTQNDICVSFPLEDSLGGKMVGIMNALRMQGKLTKDALASPAVIFAPFYRAPGTKYNQGTSGKTSLNAWPADLDRNSANYITPVYCDADGNPLMSTDPARPGYAGLPMGKETKVGKNTYWDHSERDNIVMATAAVVVSHMKSLYADDAEKANDNDGVDFGEAAAAAAPQG